MDQPDLKQTVRRAARGEERAAAALFDHYHPRVYRYALSKLRNPTAAEDVAAETFARVLRELDRFRWRGGGFEAWLFRIAGNLVVDHVRSASRERPEEDIVVRSEIAEQNTPEVAAVAAERRRELMELLDDLPEDQREVLLLRFAGGLDATEAGRVLRRNANAVRQLQFRALGNLREKMRNGVHR